MILFVAALRKLPLVVATTSSAQAPRGGVPSVEMGTRTGKPLLAPGNEAEWAKINEEKDWYERELVERLSVGERLEFGQRLSQFRAQLVAEFRARHGLD